jgi:hypothetical protein
VTISRIAKNRLREGGVRWPKTAIDLETGAVIADGSALSETKNEE